MDADRLRVADQMSLPPALLRSFDQAPVGIAVFAGARHVYQFANARYGEMMGRADLLGRTNHDTLPALIDTALSNVFDRVFSSGESFVTDRLAVPVQRRGVVETRFFTFNLEAIRNDAGRIEGLIAVAADVTNQVVRTRQLELSSKVGRALTGPEPSADKLKGCTDAIVEGLDAAFARIWSYNDSERVLELRASSGLYTHLDGPHRRVPLGQFKIGLIAAERLPHLTNAVLDDSRVSDKEWARREGMVAFAGYPLLYEDRLVGVMALFSRKPLDQASLTTLGAVADQIALGIERERTERFREMFVAMLGHDLRNPLSAIKLGAHALNKNVALPEPTRAVAGKMKGSAERMARMINQLLDFTRARSIGGIPITRLSVNLHDLVIHAVEEIRQGHPSRTILVSFGADPHGSWDHDRLAQVFSNLVGNAVAYGDPTTPVRVTITGNADSVVCEVQNQGVIASGLLPGLFDPHRRARHAKTAGSQGLGLGLFIVKEIIASHGGQLTVSSTDTDGTIFRFELPRHGRETA